MEPIVRARTCQNCRFAQFKQRNTEFYGGSGKNINGLCMKYADAPQPKKPMYELHMFFAYQSTGYHPMIARFRLARTLEDLPTFEEFAAALAEAPSYFVSAHHTQQRYFLGDPPDWYAEHYTWSAWWIRNWQTVAERKIDRTTYCEAWDGNQTSRFYKEKKAKKAKA